jgi:hypothetical protein
MTSNKACTTGNNNILHTLYIMLFVFILQFTKQRQRDIYHKANAIGLSGLVPRLIKAYGI